MKHGIIRTVYLYLFSLVGLAVLVIGAGQLIDLGLKMFVFTYADQNQAYRYEMPQPAVNTHLEDTQLLAAQLAECTDCEITSQQQEAIDNWLQDYEQWQNKQTDAQQIDYQRQSRQRQASRALSLIIIGLPLYLYHWTTIKRDKQS